MAKVQCLDCGKLTDRTRHGRCSRCSAARSAFRAAERGSRYGGPHQAQRRCWEMLMAVGVPVLCARCDELIDGPWHLDHLPDGTSAPSHADCNSAATARTSVNHARHVGVR